MNKQRCQVCLDRLARQQQGYSGPTEAAGLDESGEVTTSFQSVASYFSVRLMQCRQCGTIWMWGYFEDLDAVPIEAEWGVRTWVLRPLNAEQVALIHAREGTESLDLLTFAAPG